MNRLRLVTLDDLNAWNVAISYIHDDERTALEAYRRYLRLSRVLALEANKAVREKKAKEGYVEDLTTVGEVVALVQEAAR